MYYKIMGSTFPKWDISGQYLLLYIVIVWIIAWIHKNPDLKVEHTRGSAKL